MTGFEEPGGYSGEEHEDQGEEARALFARTVAESHPQLGFTAEDLALGGRRRVRRRRVAAVLGSTASVAVVAVAATAFAGGGGSRAAVTPPPGAAPKVTKSAAPTVPTTTAKPLTDDERALAEKKLASAVFGRMLGELDPGGKHLSHTDMPHYPGDFMPNTGICVEKSKTQIAYGISATWTIDGKNPFPRPKDATSPYVAVDIEVYAPGQGADQFAGTMDWGPITRTRLPDGSSLQTASAAQGRRLQTVRTMGNHQMIVFSVTDSWVNGGGDWGAQSLPTNPFPFTAAQLSGIVSGMSLPLPFADGYQPHSQCP